MSDINWQKVETIIDQALDLPKKKRHKFIDEKCKGKPKLKGEVTQLLDSIFNSEGWLENPEDYKRDLYDEMADDVQLLSSEKSLVDTEVGSYLIKEKIGEGGMGSVYLAEHLNNDIDHKVAIKIIRSGKATPDNIKRFKREQQILAGLHHPGIARMYDAGATEDGFPYIIMEYVNGTPITDYCQQQDCTLDQKLELFSNVLQAVRYAHENLVIHRDLKPSNILVDASGNIKILDFGISKLLEEEGDPALTKTGARLLTPRYAAPEQVRQKNITMATDLYALGIVFYQLLTNEHPFDFENLSQYEIEQAILNQEADKPSSRISNLKLQQKLQGDLDAIALKAIRKEKDHRYRVSNEFLEDLSSYKKGVPVSAVEDSFRYRSQKFLKRHKKGVAIATCVLLFLIGLTAFYTWRIAEERNQAQIEAQKAQEVSGFLIELFEANDPKFSKGETITAQQLLDTGKSRINNLDNQPAVKARMLEVLGNIYGLISEPESADSLLEKSMELKRQIYTPDNPELASIYYSWASKKTLLGDYKKASTLLDTAILYQSNIYGNQSTEVGKSLKLLSETVRKAGSIDSAYTAIRKSQEIFKNQHDTTSKGYLEVLMELASVNEAKGEFDEAKEIWKKSLKLSRDLFEPPHPIIINNINGLANILKENKEFAEAEILYTESLEMANKVYGRMHVNNAVTMNNFAGLYYYTGEYESADSLYANSYEILNEVLGEKHPYSVSTLYNIANLKSDMGVYDEAIENYKKVLKLDIESFGENHPNVASDYSGIGTLYVKKEKYDEAITNFEKSLSIRRSVYDNPYHPYIGLNLNSLANIFVELGNFEKANRFYREALTCFVKTFGKDHEKVTNVAQNYSQALELQNNLDISPDDLISEILENESNE